MASNVVPMPLPRATLADLRAMGHCKVRILARTPHKAASALFDEAAQRKGKTAWTLREWLFLLNELDSCELTVSEWLSAGTP